MIFAPDHVVKIIQGTKTETRRVIKPQPEGEYCGSAFLEWAEALASACRHYPSRKEIEEKAQRLRDGKRIFPFRDKKGKLFSPSCEHQFDSVVWIKEAWRTFEEPRTCIDGIKFRDGTFRAIEPTIEAADRWIAAHDNGRYEDRWRNPMFMSRWMSRASVRITDISVQRVQDINEQAAIAEGIIKLKASGRFVINRGAQYFGGAFSTAREAYAVLWDSINGDSYPWESNPWVFVYRFQFERGNHAAKEEDSLCKQQ